MQGRGLQSRRITDLVVVAIIYAIVLIGSFAFVAQRDGHAGWPARRAIRHYGTPPRADSCGTRRRAWRIRLRFITRATPQGLGLSAAIQDGHRLHGCRVAMAVIPPGLFLGQLAVRAVEMPRQRRSSGRHSPPGSILRSPTTRRRKTPCSTPRSTTWHRSWRRAEPMPTRCSAGSRPGIPSSARLSCCAADARYPSPATSQHDRWRGPCRAATPSCRASAVSGVTYARYFARIDADVSAI